MHEDGGPAATGGGHSGGHGAAAGGGKVTRQALRVADGDGHAAKRRRGGEVDVGWEERHQDKLQLIPEEAKPSDRCHGDE